MIISRMTDADIYGHITKNISELESFITYNAIASAVNKIEKNYKTIKSVLRNKEVLSRRVFKSSTGVEYTIICLFNQSVNDRISEALTKRDIFLCKDVNAVLPIVYTKWIDYNGRDNFLLIMSHGRGKTRMFNISPHMMSRYRERFGVSDADISAKKCKNIFEYFILTEPIYDIYGLEMIGVPIEVLNDSITQQLSDFGIKGNTLHDGEGVHYINTKHGLIVTTTVDVGVSDSYSDLTPIFLVCKTFITSDCMTNNSKYYKALLDQCCERSKAEYLQGKTNIEDDTIIRL